MKKMPGPFALCVCLGCLLFCLSACVEKKTADVGPAASSGATSGSASASGSGASSPAETSGSSGEPAPITGDTFQWAGYNTFITLYSDDPDDVGHQTNPAEGRYVAVGLDNDGEGFLYDTVSEAYAAVALGDEGGNSYTPVSMTLHLPEGTNIRDLMGAVLPDVALIFDIPADVPLASLTLQIPDGATIPMADYVQTRT